MSSQNGHLPQRQRASDPQWKPAREHQCFSNVFNWSTIDLFNHTFSFVLSSLGACVKMMEVETASSITLVTISSMIEARDCEVAIELDFRLETQAALQFQLISTE